MNYRITAISIFLGIAIVSFCIEQGKQTTKSQATLDIKMSDHDKIEKLLVDAAELQKKLAAFTQNYNTHTHQLRNLEVKRTFESAGLRTVEAGILVQPVASTYAAYADRIAAGGDSVLAELNPLQFGAGLKALRAYAVRVDPKAVTEPIDFFAFC